MFKELDQLTRVTEEQTEANHTTVRSDPACRVRFSTFNAQRMNSQQYYRLKVKLKTEKHSLCDHNQPK